MAFTRDAAVRWMELLGVELAQNREYLTQLDAAIGDSDHGINMDRGFKAVVAGLGSSGESSLDAVLKGAGMTLIRTVGGAAGPLYGTVFLRMATAADGASELDADGMRAMLEAGRKGIVDRGKAEPNDKTMLDTWEPAIRAYSEAVDAGQPMSEALQRASEAAEEGMKATIPLVARKGRASYLGERSAGHQDPGATSSYLLFRTLSQVASA